ncbi:MAG: SMC-Scp complex subunit ScpB [Oscillospiraceae bacterium]|jgi:segregation and condensation protein B|nr:SMC-Scp complex subunit ScpB [Oscillospiraceae bacterium]
MIPPEKVNILEAVLFANGEPITKRRAAEILEVTQGIVEDYVESLNERYKDSALQVLELEDCLQITTKSGYGEYIREALDTRRQARLSESALEVLAIVLYNQPITKTYIENVRGVDSSYLVNSLVEKGLLEEAGRLEIQGRPITYKTTNHFLKCFPDVRIAVESKGET